MPSHKIKKSSSARSSMEKSKEMDLKSLSEYVDDRVELIRHAFMCLKPKTIKNIAPEFLKGKSIEKLQEVCLDEVLGVSKKRLLSIINATLCPSDTESSDSDAPKIIEDHISLSEISSDDDMLEEISSKKVKKLHKKRPIKKEKNAETKKVKNGRSEAGTSTATGENQMSEKEMTVLELLELQARARAIRSQLALEPVTKIELDSDDSGTEKDKNADKTSENPVVDKSDDTSASKKCASAETSKEKPKSSTKKSSKVPTPSTKESNTTKDSENRSSKPNRSESKAGSSKEHHSSSAEERHKSSDKKKRSKRSKSRSRSKEKSPILDLRAKIEQRRNLNQTTEDKTPDPAEKPRRRVVLKRNFGSQITVTTENTSNSNDSSNKKEERKELTPEKVKIERESDRESSPDVIAMHPSPETILLTSSDDEKEPSSKKDKSKETVKAPVVAEKLVTEKPRSPIRDKSPGTLSLEAEELDYDEKMSDPESDHQQETAQNTTERQNNNQSNDQQGETGDKGSESDSESETDRNDWEDTIHDEVEKVSSHLSEAAPSQETIDKLEDVISINNSQTSLLDQKSETSSGVAPEPESVVQEDNPTEKASDIVDVDELPEKNESSGSSSSSSDSDSDNQSDQEHPTISNKDGSKCPEKDADSADDADVVTIDINESSDDGKLNEEQENNQSWGQRWLRSKKVSKVMTSTKLGNKLRSKAKEKKIEEKKAIEEKERLEKLEQERIAEEERQKAEEEKKATEVPEEVLGSTKHFKDLKLLSLLKEEREQRAAKETARKTKKK